jgi:YD repeat-containing protein
MYLPSPSGVGVPEVKSVLRDIFSSQTESHIQTDVYLFDTLIIEPGPSSVQVPSWFSSENKITCQKCQPGYEKSKSSTDDNLVCVPIQYEQCKVVFPSYWNTPPWSGDPIGLSFYCENGSKDCLTEKNSDEEDVKQTTLTKLQIGARNVQEAQRAQCPSVDPAIRSFWGGALYGETVCARISYPNQGVRRENFPIDDYSYIWERDSGNACFLGATVYKNGWPDRFYEVECERCLEGYFKSADSTGGKLVCKKLGDDEFFDGSEDEGCKNPGFGDPIHPISGAERMQVDLAVKGWPNNIVLAYNSLNGVKQQMLEHTVKNSQVGKVWNTSLHKGLRISNAGGLIYSDRGEGSTTKFLLQGGQWTNVNQFFSLKARLPSGFILTDGASGFVEEYDESGRLLSVHQKHGATHTFGYPIDFVVSSGIRLPGGISDQWGRALFMQYQPIGRGEYALSQLQDPNGRETLLQYSYEGHLSNIIWPDMSYKSFLYEKKLEGMPWALTGVVDENRVRHATITYDSIGRAVSAELASGVDKYSVTYGVPPSFLFRESNEVINGQPVSTRFHDLSVAQNIVLKMPNGAQTTIAAKAIGGGGRVSKPVLASIIQPAGAGCGQSTSSQDYDEKGNVLWRNDFNQKRQCFSYEAQRALQVRKVEGLAASAVCADIIGGEAPIPNGSRKISTAWHPDWAMKIKEAQPNLLTTWVYNGQLDPFTGSIANCISPTYGATVVDALPDGKPIAVLCKKVEQATKDANGSQGLSPVLDTSALQVTSRTWTYTYNQYGQVLTSTDPNQNTTTNEYHCQASADCGAGLKHSFTGTAPNEVGHYQGDLWKVTNPKGHVTEYLSYDRAGRVLSMKDPNGLVTSYSYTPRGWISSESRGGQATTYEYWPTGLLKKVTQPDQSYLYYQYDDAHRLTDVTDKVDANGALIGNTVHYTLDNAGNRKGEDVKDTSNSLTRNIGRTYDALNRLQFVTGAQQ